MAVILNESEKIAKTILTMPVLYRRLRGTVNHSENRR